MRTPTLLAAALCGILALSAAAEASQPKRAPAPALRGHDCLEPAFARSFTTLDNRSLLVDAGRNRYRIEVSPSCWNLDFANTIGFRGDPISNRVCGSSLDMVLVRGSNPCRVERMELLSKEEYKQALRERADWRRSGRVQRADPKYR